MGAWGHRVFEEDGALDAIEDLLDEDEIAKAVAGIFESCEELLVEGEYLDLEDVSQSFAACALVAEAVSPGAAAAAGYPGEIELETQERHELAELAADARGVIQALLSVAGELNEWVELWVEAGEIGEARAGVSALLERLGGE